MLIKLITSSLRSLGMFLIFIFACASIFGSIFVRDIDNSTFLGNFLDYTISFENRFYDYRMKSMIQKNQKNNDIVLLKIDDYSLEKLGVWPIPRTYHAQMIDKLREFGTKVVAMDVLFPEKSPPIDNISPDEVLVTSIKNFQSSGGRVFIGYTLANHEDEALKEVPLELLNDAIVTRNVPEVDMKPMKISRYTFPISKLVESEVGLGTINASEDRDGIFRQYNLVANIDTIYYGSLALNAFEAYTGTKNTIKIFADASGELEIENKKLEITDKGEVKIRYVGAEDIFNSVSFYDLITAKENDPEMKKMFDGKMVFVGSTALGAHDLRPSPLDAKMPGVYSHMNMAYMLMKKYFFQSSNDSVKYSLIMLFISMIIFMFIQRLGNAFLDAGVVVVLLSSYYVADKYYFMPEGYELKLFYSFFCLISCYSWNTFLKFYEANKEKKQIRGTFARYVAPTVVDEMLKDPDKLHVGGTKMDITCLFSDVRDFTKISEGLTATELAHSLNIYMGAMTDIVFDNKGTLDKYIGDAIVALWGAPLEIGNHAQFAVESAVKMMNGLPAINDEFRKLGRPVFNVGIGLNTGECSVGNMGSSRIFSYTALGDNMNLGARLESLCKYYGTQILISDMTLERLDLTNLKVRPIDKVVVKGKTQAVGIHEVLHAEHWMTKDRESLELYLSAWTKFAKKEFQESLTIFNHLLEKNEKDIPTKRLRDLCQKYCDQPESVDDHFDVTIMKEK